MDDYSLSDLRSSHKKSQMVWVSFGLIDTPTQLFQMWLRKSRWQNRSIASDSKQEYNTIIVKAKVLLSFLGSERACCSYSQVLALVILSNPKRKLRLLCPCWCMQISGNGDNFRHFMVYKWQTRKSLKGMEKSPQPWYHFGWPGQR